VIVTDRTDLDDQIAKTFLATGQEPKRAATGENLLSLIEDKTPVVTTLIHKFRAGLNKRRVVDISPEIFVLVDESHRSQYGSLDSLHARMREVLPNACFIAFTGTPIAKKEKSTFAKFGEFPWAGHDRGRFFFDEREANIFGERLGHLLAVESREFRLGIEQIHLAGATVLHELDDGLGLGRKMRWAGPQITVNGNAFIWCNFGCAQGGAMKQIGQRDATKT
jgi:transcriptional regulator of met regulon